MADKIPDSQILPAGAHAEKKSVHKSDRKKSLSWTVLLDNIKLLAREWNRKKFSAKRGVQIAF